MSVRFGFSRLRCLSSRLTGTQGPAASVLSRRPLLAVSRPTIATYPQNLLRSFATKAEGSSDSDDAKAKADEQQKADETKTEDAKAEAKAEETEQAAEEVPEEVKLQNQLTDLQEQIKAEKHKLLLSLAEFENNKKKFVKEREDRRRRSTVNFATTMVEVYSEFDRFADVKHEGVCQGLFEGVSLTRDLYKNTLARFDVSQMEVEEGSPLNVNRHEKVGEAIRDDLPKDSVAECVKPGWEYLANSKAPVVVKRAEVKVVTRG
eukprot:TRINITY_DN95916_c0_g1_i1.p1 TRINITY_DN95916_c0_g1~~TRINITY_DN95916_c0_g1_i1.p1  ORF type:complete len:262 (+),score=70.10 TRINITY_DN95916_c0_g1_i1:119-904(+)